MSKGNIGNIGKLLLTGVVGGAIALGGNAIYQNTQGTNNSSTNSNTNSTQVSKVNVSVNTDTTAAIAKVSNAVVSVLNYSTSNSSSSIEDILSGNSSSSNTPTLSSEGSGVIYKKEGNTAYVVTNYHVIAGNSSLDVQMAGGQKVKATVVGYDTYTDLAVLKIDAKYVDDVATFANSDDLTVGEPAIAVGSPLGSQFANTATEGIVSAKSRQVTLTQDSGATTNINAIQTDAAINPGNSGGALINIEGQVIGITQSKLTSTGETGVSAEGMGFAIPSNTVTTIIAQLEKNGKVVRPALGISMYDLSNFSSETLTQQLNLPASITGGVLIEQVQSGMPAATAGLKQGDVITKVGDTTINSGTDLQVALFKYNIGDTITITYYRDGKQHTASVKLNKQQSDLSSSLTSGDNSSSDNSSNSDNSANSIFGGN